jgi:hypothetical protein
LRKLILAIAISLLMLFPSPASAESKSCPKWEPAIKAAGLPVKDFSYIAWRESRCRIKAINATWNEKGEMTYHLNKNKSWDSGLLQINSGHREMVRRVCGGDLPLLLTLDCNLAAAKHLYDAHGLAPWTFVKPHAVSPQLENQLPRVYRNPFPR